MTDLRTEVAEYLQKRDDTMLINMPIEIYLGRAEIIIALINKRWQDWLVKELQEYQEAWENGGVKSMRTPQTVIQRLIDSSPLTCV